MVSDKVNFDLGSDFDDSIYKSCFARSVVVNSQQKAPKSLHNGQVDRDEDRYGARTEPAADRPLNGSGEAGEVVRLRKNLRLMEENRRFSYGSASCSRRTSICSGRISEIPVQNIVQQSKVETLQWQLKEIEKSREMYKAVMKQVVTFLEKAHRSLELLGNKPSPKSTVPRSKSEHQIVTDEATPNPTTDYATFRDFTLRRPKKESPDEVPPEKLAREAFRLLRTAQSLLSTQEPNLAQTANESGDFEFLAQLAKEFPPSPEVRPQRTTSFSLSPKLILPENDVKISTAFNRKLSLQLNETRRTVYREISKISHNYSRSSLVEGENFLSSTVNDFTAKHHDRFVDKSKNDLEKSNSPPGGSISSVEDESGFSSMNSFQDVGLPVISDDVTAKNALLRSMLYNNDNVTDNPVKYSEADDVKLWQTPEKVAHKRWSSTPEDVTSKQPVKVLWV